MSVTICLLRSLSLPGDPLSSALDRTLEPTGGPGQPDGADKWPDLGCLGDQIVRLSYDGDG